MSMTARASLTEAHEKTVRPWIDLVDTLRAQGVHEDLPLPQIAVMGDQSSGKSSVLEALSGVPFPRGTGLVTRCPTQLIMKRTPLGTAWNATATIQRLHGAGLPQPIAVSSPSELTGIISRLTEQLTAGATFSQDSIVVQVFSPDVPDLTIIDLPGIVRTHTSGQDRNVIRAVDDLLDVYLESERTIILAVIPSNQDIATVDILERAAEVDPKGDRTIGVLTKPDMVSPGSEQGVVETVSNRLKPLKLGYVIMKNRSQTELAEGTSLAEARTTERRYFESHDVYSKLPPNLVGANALTTRLADLLVKRIKTVLPVMKFELLEMQREVTREIKLMGREAPTGRSDRINALMKIVAEYCSLLRNAVSGDYRKDVLALEPRLRLRTIADTSFRVLTDKIRATEPNFDSATFHASLESEIRALKGRELPGLVNSYFFFSFMVSKIEDWHAPVAVAKHELFDTTIAIGNALFTHMCPQYPRMGELVASILEQWVEDHVSVVETRIDEAFKQEEDPFVSTDELANEIVKVRSERFDRALNHVLKLVGDKAPDTEGVMAKVSKATSAERTKAGLVDLEEQITDKLGQWYMANHGVSAAALIEDMRTVLTAYWRLSSKRLTENVCMSFEAHVLQKLSEEIESELLTAVQLRPDVDDLFFEPPEMVAARANLKVRKARFDGAMDTINKLAPDTVAVSRRVNDDATDSATAAAIAARKAKRLGLPPPGVSSGQGAQRGGAAGVAVAGIAGQRSSGGPSGLGGDGAGDSGEPIMVFEFSGKNGDNNGYIYWLGTEGKTKKFENPHTSQRLKVTSSGMAVGEEAAVVSRKRGEVAVKAGADVFLCLDLGRSRTMAPTHYTLCHGSAASGCDLLSFTLEGFSKTHNKWIDLATPAKDARVLKSPHGVGTWVVDAKGDRFRYLRVKSMGPNQKGDNSLPICAFEFYGSLYRS